MLHHKLNSCFILAAAAVVFFSCQSQKQSTTKTTVFIQQKEHTDGKWKLIWQDEFNGSSIDTLKWTKIPAGKSDWNKHMSSDEKCYAVKDGLLFLNGIVNTDTATDHRPYLTGGVYTKGTFSFQYGKIEIRAKLPTAQGAWPAMWMLSEQDKYGKYPRNGEIDIMEHLNFDNIIYQTVHSYYTLELKQDNNPPHYGTAKMKENDYNVFGLEWYSDKLVFTLNGVPTFTYPRKTDADKSQWPFDQPFYVMIDMQLGGNWVGKINPSHLPVSMMVDWVRVYQ